MPFVNKWGDMYMPPTTSIVTGLAGNDDIPGIICIDDVAFAQSPGEVLHDKRPFQTLLSKLGLG